MSGYWELIEPEATENEVLNPQAGDTANFAAVGGGTQTRVTTYSLYGVRSYRVQTAANNEGGSWTLAALANAIHYVTMRVRGTLPTAWDWSVDGANYTAPTLIQALDGNWSLYGLQLPAVQCNGSTTLEVRQNGAGAGDFYVDGVQVEEKEYRTTYCDGDQEGCEWIGAEHESASERSAISRAGGRPRDLRDTYAFYIKQVVGTGMQSPELAFDAYALLPGGELNNAKVGFRAWVMVGKVLGDSPSDQHANRQALAAVLRTDRSAIGSQPVRLRYSGATVVKEIAARYVDGLGFRSGEAAGTSEQVQIRFESEDPFWYGIGEASTVLDHNDSQTMHHLAGRLRSTGQWDELGLSNAPLTLGTVRAIAVAPDGDIYFGGQWTGLDAVAGRDYIARYTPSTDTWATVGAGSALNGIVYALAFDASGTLYVGGAFTNAGRVANADYIATWDGSNWAAVGNPNAGGAAMTAVYAVAIDKSGKVLIGGIFTNVAGVAAADYVAIWDGAAWAAIGIPNAGTAAITAVWAIAVNSQDEYVVGGDFTDWANVSSADYIAIWDGSSWSALSTGMNGIVYALAIAQDDVVYAGGAFTTAGGMTVNRIALYSGQGWSTLSDGLSSMVYALDLAPDGTLYVAGVFTTAGILDIRYVGQWNGSSWAPLDIRPNLVPAYAVAVGRQDPVIEQNVDLYIGGLNSNVKYYAGLASVTVSGTQRAMPRIYMSRSGGTSARLKSVRNETTGRTLYANYLLLDGEELEIDLRPTRKRIVSSFFGDVPGAVLPGSDVGQFALDPGDNDVSCFIDEAGAPTVEAAVIWREAYKGVD